MYKRKLVSSREAADEPSVEAAKEAVATKRRVATIKIILSPYDSFRNLTSPTTLQSWMVGCEYPLILSWGLIRGLYVPLHFYSLLVLCRFMRE
jgi:hypothetical protein